MQPRLPILKKNDPPSDHQVVQEQTEKTAELNQAEARAKFLAMDDEGFQQIIAAQASEKSIAEETAPDTEATVIGLPVTAKNQTQLVRVDVQPIAETFTSSSTAEASLTARPDNNTNQIPFPEITSSNPAETPVENQTISNSEGYVPEVEVPAVDNRIFYPELVPELPQVVNVGDANILQAQEIMSLMPEAGLIEVTDSESEETAFDEEVMDTFEQLVVLIDREQEEIPLIDLETDETSGHDEIILLGQELAEAIQANRINVFEEFVMAKTPPETTPDIDKIVTEAADRPLEETLVQLSYYLAEAGTEPTDKSRQINKALKELADILPPSLAEYKGQELQAVITPEMTQKLLILLRAVGYDNPREVLVGFVERNDFEFLLQAIRYLYQLSDKATQQELLLTRPVNFTVMDVAEPLANRLGRAIMQRLFLHDAAILPA